ncbi:MAG: DUF6588 family protein [Bacteroidota bacterium]
MKRLFLSIVCGTFIAATTAYSQGLQETLQKVAGNAAVGYVSPITNGFGTDLNGGWFHKAPSATMFGFDLEFGIVAMGTPFKNADKTFDTNGDFRFDESQTGTLVDAAIAPPAANDPLAAQKNALRTSLTNKIANTDFNIRINGPTVSGNQFVNNATTPNDQVTVTFSSRGITFPYTNPATGQTRDTTLTIPAKVFPLGFGGVADIQKLSLLPLGAPQLSIGTIAGTQLTFRYLPSVNSSGVGKFSYFGFGIAHNPGIWFPTPLPVDLSASFFTQTLKFDPYIVAKSTAFGVNVSKRFGPGALNVTPYAGFLVESSKLTFSYTPTATLAAGAVAPPISFELDGANTSRLVLGLSFKLAFININADYDIAKYNSFTGGVMFII